MIISCETNIVISFLGDVSYYNSAFVNPSTEVIYYLTYKIYLVGFRFTYNIKNSLTETYISETCLLLSIPHGIHKALGSQTF